MRAAVQPELKQPLVKVMWQRSSADDRGLAHELKEELGMDVGNSRWIMKQQMSKR